MADGYDLFISYSRDPDYALARDLDLFLDQFHELALQAGHNVPPLKVCRDDSDFTQPSGKSPADLRSIVTQSLESSSELLVLCSPQARESAWVDWELTWFLEHKGADYIRVALTDGEDIDFLPKALKDAGLDLRLWYDFRQFRDRTSKADYDTNRIRLAKDLLGQAADDDLLPAYLRQQQLHALSSQSQKLIITSQRIAERSPGEALSLATEAVRKRIDARESPGLADETLHAALTNFGGRDILSFENCEISNLAVSNNGRWLAAAGYSGFNPSGRWMAILDTQPEDWRELSPEPNRPTSALAFSYDSQWLASGHMDGTVMLWSLAGNDPSASPIVLEAHSSPIRALCFTQDGTKLVSASGEIWAGEDHYDNSVRVWDLDYPIPEPRIIGEHERVARVETSLGELVFSTGVGGVEVWSTNAEQESLPEEFNGLSHARVSTDGQFVISCDEHDGVVVRDLGESMSESANLDDIKYINAVLMGPNGTWFGVWARTSEIWIWRHREAKPFTGDLSAYDKTRLDLKQYFDRYRKDVVEIRKEDLFYGDFLICMRDEHSVLCKWVFDWNSNEIVVRNHDQKLTATAIGPQSWLLASADPSGNVRVSYPLRTTAAMPVRIHMNTSRVVRAAVFSTSGRWLVSGGVDGVVTIWDLLASPRWEQRYIRTVGRVPSGDISAVAISDCETWIAAAGEKIWIWGAFGNRGERFTSTVTDLIDLMFTGDGRAIVFSIGREKRSLMLIDLQNDDLKAVELASFEESWATIILDREANCVLAVRDKQVDLWDATSAESLQSTRSYRYESRIRSAGVGGGGQIVAINTESTLEIWRTDKTDETPETIKSLEGHYQFQPHVHVSVDGSVVATTTSNNDILVFDRRKPDDPIRILAGHMESIGAAKILNNSLDLVSFDEQGEIRVWPLDSDTNESVLYRLGKDEKVGTIEKVSVNSDDNWLLLTILDPNHYRRVFLVALSTDIRMSVAEATLPNSSVPTETATAGLDLEPIQVTDERIQVPDPHKAIKDRERVKLQQWLANGGDPNTRDANHRTPVHVAASVGDVTAIEMLVRANADIESVDTSGQTPLIVAIRNGNSKAANVLMRHGVNTNARDTYGWTALFVAVFRGDEKVIAKLIENGADVSAEKDGWQLLHYATASLSASTIKLIASHSDSIDIRSSAGLTPLHLTAESYGAAEIKELLQLGASVDLPDISGATPLFYAASTGSVEKTSLLIANGADPNARTRDDNTPLHAGIGNQEVTKLLLASGAKSDVQNRWGQSPLMTAAYKGDARSSELLLECRADSSQRNRAGDSALMIAIKERHEDIVEILLKYGVDANVANEKGTFPLQLAAAYGETGLVQILVEAGGKLDAQDSSGRTALHEAVLGKHTEVVRQLIELGTDPFVQDKAQRASRDLADTSSRSTILAILDRAMADRSL